MEHKKSIYNITQNTETATLEKPSDKLNTGSTIRTSTVLKGPHPKLRMTGGRKPAANASATGASAPKAAVATAKALGPPAAETNTHTQKGGLPPRLCALILGASLPHLRLNG